MPPNKRRKMPTPKQRRASDDDLFPGNLFTVTEPLIASHERRAAPAPGEIEVLFNSQSRLPSTTTNTPAKDFTASKHPNRSASTVPRAQLSSGNTHELAVDGPTSNNAAPRGTLQQEQLERPSTPTAFLDMSASPTPTAASTPSYSFKGAASHMPNAQKTFDDCMNNLPDNETKQRLRSAFDASIARKGQYRRSLRESQSKIASLREDIVQLNTQLDVDQRKCRDIAQEILHAEGIKLPDTEPAGLEHVLASVRRMLEDSKNSSASIKEYKIKVGTLQDELDMVNEDKEALKKTNEHLWPYKEKYEKDQQRSSEAAKAADRSRTEYVHVLEKDSTDLREKSRSLAKAKAALEEELERYKAEKQWLEQRSHELQKVVTEREATIEESKTFSTTLQIKTKKLELENEGLKKQSHTSLERISELEANATKLAAEKQSRSDSHKELQTSIDKLQEELQTIRNETRAKTERVTDLQEQLKTAVEAHDHLTATIQEHVSTEQNLKSELAGVQRQLLELKPKAEEVTRIQLRLNNALKVQDELHTANTAYVDKERESKAELQQLQKALATQREQLKVANDKHDAREKTNKKRIGDLENLYKNVLREKADAGKQSQQEIDRLKGENAKLQRNLAGNDDARKKLLVDLKQKHSHELQDRDKVISRLQDTLGDLNDEHDALSATHEALERHHEAQLVLQQYLQREESDDAYILANVQYLLNSTLRSNARTEQWRRTLNQAMEVELQKLRNKQWESQQRINSLEEESHRLTTASKFYQDETSRLRAKTEASQESVVAPPSQRDEIDVDSACAILGNVGYRQTLLDLHEIAPSLLFEVRIDGRTLSRGKDSVRSHAKWFKDAKDVKYHLEDGHVWNTICQAYAWIPSPLFEIAVEEIVLPRCLIQNTGAGGEAKSEGGNDKSNDSVPPQAATVEPEESLFVSEDEQPEQEPRRRKSQDSTVSTADTPHNPIQHIPEAHCQGPAMEKDPDAVDTESRRPLTSRPTEGQRRQSVYIPQKPSRPSPKVVDQQPRNKSEALPEAPAQLNRNEKPVQHVPPPAPMDRRTSSLSAASITGLQKSKRESLSSIRTDLPTQAAVASLPTPASGRTPKETGLITPRSPADDRSALSGPGKRCRPTEFEEPVNKQPRLQVEDPTKNAPKQPRAHAGDPRRTVTQPVTRTPPESHVHESRRGQVEMRSTASAPPTEPNVAYQPPMKLAPPPLPPPRPRSAEPRKPDRRRNYDSWRPGDPR